jgi:hypothetical protein
MTKTRFPDPYEEMSDDELDRHFSEIIANRRKRQQAILIGQVLSSGVRATSAIRRPSDSFTLLCR